MDPLTYLFTKISCDNLIITKKKNSETEKFNMFITGIHNQHYCCFWFLSPWKKMRVMWDEKQKVSTVSVADFRLSIFSSTLLWLWFCRKLTSYYINYHDRWISFCLFLEGTFSWNLLSYQFSVNKKRFAKLNWLQLYYLQFVANQSFRESE